jgi:hypothetical protein
VWAKAKTWKVEIENLRLIGPHLRRSKRNKTLEPAATARSAEEQGGNPSE